MCNFSHLDTAPPLRSRSLAARIEIAIGQRADKDERPGAVICCVARTAVCVICPGFFGSCIVGRDLFFSSGPYVASVYFVPSVNDGQCLRFMRFYLRCSFRNCKTTPGVILRYSIFS